MRTKDEKRYTRDDLPEEAAYIVRNDLQRSTRNALVLHLFDDERGGALCGRTGRQHSLTMAGDLPARRQMVFCAYCDNATRR